MAGYQRDETVDVVIRGGRVIEGPHDAPPGWLAVQWVGDDGLLRLLQLDTGHRAVEVYKMVPPLGPPQAGDVWTDDEGRMYWARLMDIGDAPRVVLVDADATHSGLNWHEWKEVYRDRGLTLLWRPPAPAPASEPPAALEATAVQPLVPPPCLCPSNGLLPCALHPDPDASGYPVGGRHG